MSSDLDCLAELDIDPLVVDAQGVRALLQGRDCARCCRAKAVAWPFTLIMRRWRRPSNWAQASCCCARYARKMVRS